MTYKKVFQTIESLFKKDREFLLKAEIAVEVHNNIDTSGLSEEDIETLCERIKNAFLNVDGGNVQIYEWCYQINSFVESGLYDSPLDKECIVNALKTVITPVLL